ncbi:serine/threonine-protein kinase [Streptomyces toxytricini]|uniref:Serine/threonine-protein kinase n=1 Tax=Streptomyces toxytricini TaxID=67369 RepID=A0ABW8ERF1_STRT5
MQPLTDDDPRQLGAYQVLYRLGEGGMGCVYLARSAGGRTVALKTIRGEFAGDPGFRERFAREVNASRSLAGPGIVPVLDADVDASVPWLASAYAPGPTLAEAVRMYGPLPEAALWRLLNGLARSLESIHGAGFVHRDIKPSNVLVTQAGPLIIDFGIARSANATVLTSTGLVVGSPGYMSPEQAEGQRVGPPSDIFSLGAVLAFSATRRSPFGAGSAAQLLYRVVHLDPDLVGVPDGFASVVRSCLAKDPATRPTAAELYAIAGGSQEEGAYWLPTPVMGAIAQQAEFLLNLEVPDEYGQPALATQASTQTTPLTDSDPDAPAHPTRARASTARSQSAPSSQMTTSRTLHSPEQVTSTVLLPVVLAVVVLLVVGGALYGGWRWTQTQVYVGANDGHVALYRGVSQDLAWVSLSRVQQDHPEIELKYLPPYLRKQVESTTAAGGSTDRAKMTVAELAVQASACKKAEQTKSRGEGGSAPTGLSAEEQKVVMNCGKS